MGAKGTSINVTDLSATYVALSGMFDQVNEFVSVITTNKQGIVEKMSEGAVDEASAAALEEIISDLTKTIDGISVSIREVKKWLDRGLAASMEIQKQARAQANTVQERVQNVNKRFKR